MNNYWPADHIPSELLTTPTQYAKRKRDLRAMRVEIRIEVAALRAARASEKWWVRQDDGSSEWFFAVTWPRYRLAQEWLRTHVAIKYSHISPNAANRAIARTGLSA